MKKVLILFYILIVSSVVHAQSTMWANFIGNSNNDKTYAMHIDQQENVLLAGSFWQTVILAQDTLVSKGPINAYVAKYDSAGNFRWSLPVYCSRLNYICGLTTDSQGDIYISGFFEDTLLIDSIKIPASRYEDIFYAKISSSGNLIWVKTIRCPGSDSSYGIRVNQSDHPVLFGDVKGSVTINGTYISIPRGGAFFAELDTDGNLLNLEHTVSADSASIDLYTSYIDFMENTYMAGYFNGTVNFDSVRLSTPAWTTGSPNYLVKYNSLNQAQWAIELYGAFGLGINTIETDAELNVYLGGSFYYNMTINDSTVARDHNGRTGFVAKFSPFGDLLWYRCINELDGGIEGENRVSSLAFNTNGNLLVGGTFDGNFTYDSFQISDNDSAYVYVLQLDPRTGAAVGLLQTGGSIEPEDLRLSNMELANDGNLLLSGSFKSIINFYTLPSQYSQGSSDIFLAKISPPAITATPAPTSLASLSVYPNPASKQLYFTLPGTTATPWQCTLLDLAGRQVFTAALEPNQSSMALPALPAGMYVLQLSSGQQVHRQKLLVEQ